MNTLVRKMLIESARKYKPLVYSEVMSKIGLDHADRDDRNEFSRILENISRFEHSKKRPLLSAQIIYKGSGEIGKKFYWLASQLKYGKQRQLEADVFEGVMMKKCHDFWTDEEKYTSFFNDSGEEDSQEPGSRILNRTLIPIIGKYINREAQFSFGGYDIDWLRLAEENLELGKSGEELVIRYEKEKLQISGFKKFADHVVKVKDGMGYDILSFFPNGQEKYIEVKTTEAGPNSSFPISANEREFSKFKPDQYYLYRLYNFKTNNLPIDFFEFKGDLDLHFHFQPLVFRAVHKENPI